VDRLLNGNKRIQISEHSGMFKVRSGREPTEWMACAGRVLEI
jgi:hypothetical protein